MGDMFEGVVVNALSSISDRLDAIEKKMGSGASSDATPRMQNDRGDWVYNIEGLKENKDRDTGEPMFWVKTKSGKNIPVDRQGYAMFDPDRPLLKQGNQAQVPF